MKKITFHLWYNKEAKKAAEFYTSTFKDSKIKNISTIHNTPSGSVDIVTIEILGQEFTLISAGPLFKFNPSVSFTVNCESVEEVDSLWEKISEKGTALMELGEYPFSKRYGWLKDKYGVSWQIVPTILGELMKKKPKQVTEAFLKMKKFNIAELEKAAEEE